MLLLELFGVHDREEVSIDKVIKEPVVEKVPVLDRNQPQPTHVFHDHEAHVCNHERHNESYHDPACCVPIDNRNHCSENDDAVANGGGPEFVRQLKSVPPWVFERFGNSNVDDHSDIQKEQSLNLQDAEVAWSVE